MKSSLLNRIIAWNKDHPLAFALLVGLGLRLIAIESRSLQYDDTFSIFLSSRSLPEIVRGTAADTMPPLYYFLLHFWLLISRQVWFIRLLSVLVSLVVMILLYQVVMRWFGRSAAGWAAFLAAVSPLQIYHAQDIRMYMLLVLGQIGFIWFFTRIWFTDQDGQMRLLDWAGLVFSGLIAMYSHNLAIFALVVPDLFVLLHRRWKLLARLVAAQLVMGLGTLPWLIMLPGQLEKIQHAFWTPRPGLVEIIQAVIMFNASLPLPQILLFIAAILSFQILIMLLIELRRSARGSSGAVYLSILLLAPPVLLFIVSYVMRPVFVPRGFLISSLAYFGLAGFAISASWSRGPGKLIAGAFILAAALTLPSFYTFRDFPRSPYQAAAQYLEEKVPSGAMVIHENKLSYFPMHFYAPELTQTFIADMPGSENDTYAPASQQAMQIIPQPNLIAAAQGYNDVYFVTFTRVFTEYRQLGQAESPAIQWLDAHYKRTDHMVFGDLEVFQYDR